MKELSPRRRFPPSVIISAYGTWRVWLLVMTTAQFGQLDLGDQGSVTWQFAQTKCHKVRRFLGFRFILISHSSVPTGPHSVTISVFYIWFHTAHNRYNTSMAFSSGFKFGQNLAAFRARKLADRALALAVNCWLLTAEDRVQFQGSSCRICGEWSGTYEGFHENNSLLHPIIIPPFPFIWFYAYWRVHKEYSQNWSH
jgi:hypothetical protein